jgi:hypothetical protein
MTEAELEEILSARFEEGCADGWGALLLEHGLIGAAMNLALRRKGVVPFRAAYALERAFLRAPDRFEPYYERFTADFAAAVHRSVWRHYGKIMALLLKRKALTPDDGQAVRIAEAALERLIDGSVPVGARVWSIDILHELRGRVPWIDRELPGLIDGLTLAPSPAMISRLRRFRFIK